MQREGSIQKTGDLYSQVYQPESDTYLLLNAAIRETRPHDRVLEVGCGSGFIAARLSEIARLVATDINPHAVCAARLQGIDAVRTDLVAGVCGRFDLVLFNPPYLPTRPEERMNDWLEMALDGGATGRDVIARFIPEAGRVLAENGRILLLCSSLTGLSEVRELISSCGYVSIIAAREVIEGETLYVLRIFRDLCKID
jgi:release factor glutamine methyltransferase